MRQGRGRRFRFMIVDWIRQVWLSLSCTTLCFMRFVAASYEYRFHGSPMNPPFGYNVLGRLRVIFFCAMARCVLNFRQGRVAEWLMAPVLKTGVPERVSGVRIPPLPPFRLRFVLFCRKNLETRRNTPGFPIL